MDRRYFKMWIGALLAVFLIAGCGGGGSSSISAQTGTLNVSLTDAAAGGFDEVNVTVGKVRVHKSADAEEGDAGWSEIVLDPARKLNLLDLQNGVLENLGETSLPAGHYTQLRLVLVSKDGKPYTNSVVPAGGEEIALVTPSAVQSGIKLINQFDVAAGERVDLVLDFDALKSVVKRGKGAYALKPVIRVFPMVVSGGITGFIDMTGVENPMVTAQLNGEIVTGTTPLETGEFKLSPLVQSSTAGNYTVVITADNRAATIISGVPVTAQEDTIVSTNDAPIVLPASGDPATRNVSGTVTLNPTSTTTEVALVAARQSITEDLTVTITEQNVALTNSTGDYTLTLPIAAPLLGEYGDGTLPITFAEQADAAGKYTVKASADGYTPQESELLYISTEDKTQDFELTVAL